MTLIIPIITLIVLGLGLIYLAKKILLKENNRFRHISYVSFKYFIVASVPITIFLYLIYIVGLGFENYYNLKKGTLMWYVMMEDETIAEFPIISQTTNQQYNSIGGDSPSIAQGWEVEYYSNADINDVNEKVTSYLKTKGYDIKRVSKPTFYWKFKQAEGNQIYSGKNSTGKIIEYSVERLNNKTQLKIHCEVILQ